MLFVLVVHWLNCKFAKQFIQSSDCLYLPYVDWIVKVADHIVQRGSDVKCLILIYFLLKHKYSMAFTLINGEHECQGQFLGGVAKSRQNFPLFFLVCGIMSEIYDTQDTYIKFPCQYRFIIHKIHVVRLLVKIDLRSTTYMLWVTLSKKIYDIQHTVL